MVPVPTWHTQPYHHMFLASDKCKTVQSPCGNGGQPWSVHCLPFNMCCLILDWSEFSPTTSSPMAKWTAKAIAKSPQSERLFCCCAYGTSLNKVERSPFSQPSSSSVFTSSLKIKANWWVSDELRQPTKILWAILLKVTQWPVSQIWCVWIPSCCSASKPSVCHQDEEIAGSGQYALQSAALPSPESPSYVL